MFHPIRLSFAFFHQFFQFFLFFRREPNDIFLVHTDPFQKNDTLKVVSAIPIQPLKSNVMRYYYPVTIEIVGVIVRRFGAGTASTLCYSAKLLLLLCEVATLRSSLRSTRRYVARARGRRLPRWPRHWRVCDKATYEELGVK